MDKAINRAVRRQEIASRLSDPTFQLNLRVLPNPDHVLRKLGQSDRVYAAIMSDAHVLGEIREKRTALMRREWHLLPGGDDPASTRAFELCSQVMLAKPWQGGQWYDVFFNMLKSIYLGHRIHEVTWQLLDNVELPLSVKDRPNSRFHFGVENELRRKTVANRIEGEEVEPYKFLVTTHMAEHDNPYGTALLSACYWPWVFKTTGFEFFVKFCERFGFPWVLGKYPFNTPEDQVEEMLDGLAQMIEDSVGVVPDGGQVEAHQFSASGEVVHERLIDKCNIEISKVLSGQSMNMEIKGKGSYAASQTNKQRSNEADEGDIQLVIDTMNQLFEWVTELNVNGALPPKIKIFDEGQATVQMADMIDKSRKFLKIPAPWAHKVLKVPQPKDDEDVLPGSDTTPQTFSRQQFDDFRARTAVTDKNMQEDALERLGNLPDAVADLIENADSYDDILEGLPDAIPGITSTEIAEFMNLAMSIEAYNAQNA